MADIIQINGDNLDPHSYLVLLELSKRPDSGLFGKQFQIDSGKTLTTSLLSYYKLDDGTDYFGTRNLTVVGNTVFGTGKVGNAAYFDGVDDGLDGGNVFNFERTDSFSVSAWVKRNTSGTSDFIAGNEDFLGTNTGWAFDIAAADQATVELSAGAGNSCSARASIGNSDTGSAHHYVMTYNGTSDVSGIKIYVDGVSKTLTTVSNNLVSSITTTGAFRLGLTNDNSADLDGYIDEVGIWTKVLTQTEVSDLYNGGAGQTMITP